MFEDLGIMKKFCMDRGVIKFVLMGANIMCPRLTFANNKVDLELVVDFLVGTFPFPLR